MWITIAFDTSDDFGQPSCRVIYNGYEIEIKMGSSTEPHNLYIEGTDRNEKEILEAGYKFLSELAWLFNTRVEVLATGGAGNHKMPIGIMGRSYNRILNSIHLDDYEQVASSNEQKLALGLYREAISSNSKFYAFLCYFKIINILYKTGLTQKNWINNNISRIRNNKKTLEGFRSSGITDIGDHMYHSGRCAIAHASIQSGEPIADPDCYEDIYRISSELDLIQELAQIFMSEELKVPDKFEAIKIKMLKKFRDILGEDIVREVITQQDLDLTRLPCLPKMSIGVYKASKDFNVLSNLEFNALSAGDGRILLSNKDQDWPIEAELTVDFVKKELNFRIVQIRDKHAKVNDNFILNYYRFLKAYVPNGRLEIWNSENEELLARLWPNIPVNIDLDKTMNNIQEAIDYLEQKIKRQ